MITDVTSEAIQTETPEAPARFLVGSDAFLGPVSAFEIPLPRSGTRSQFDPAASGQRLRATPALMTEPLADDVLYDIALDSLARAQKHSSSANAWIEAGFALLAVRELIEARNAFGLALATEQSNRRALLGLARVAKEENKPEEAVQLLRRLFDQDPANVEVAVNLALALVSAGREEEALVVLKQDPPADARNATFFATRGSLLLSRNQPATAIRDLRTAVRLRPSWVHARNTLGIAEAMNGNLRGAERRFREAVRVSPMFSASLVNLARILASEQRWGEIVDLVERYWSPDRAPFDLALLAANAAIEEGNTRTARPWLDAALTRATTPEDRSLVLNNLGVVADRMSRPEDAFDYFAQAVEVHPTDISISNYAKAFLEKGRPDQAVERIRGLVGDPAELGPSTRHTLAVAYFHLGQFAACANELQSLVNEVGERKAADVGAHALLACVLSDGVGDLNAAISVLERGLALSPNDPGLLNNLAYVRLSAGDFEQGEEVLRQLRDAKMSAEQRVHVVATDGLLAFRKGDGHRGWELYEDAARLAPRKSLRERVKAKRDLEMGRFLVRSGDQLEAKRYFVRAADAKALGYPYSAHARAELAGLTPEADQSSQ